jgi:hypothetical protein
MHFRALQCLRGQMLTHSADLERDGLVLRTVYPEAPIRVDYELTPLDPMKRAAAATGVGRVRCFRTDGADRRDWIINLTTMPGIELTSERT